MERVRPPARSCTNRRFDVRRITKPVEGTTSTINVSQFLELPPDTADPVVDPPPARARARLGLVAVFACTAIAIGVLLQLRDQSWPIVVEGDFSAVAAPRETAPAPHPLVTAAPRAATARVADGPELGRSGTSMVQDLDVILGAANATSRAAVPAMQLAGDAIAWSSPRQLRLVPATSATATNARADLCASGIDAAAPAGDLLVVAACGSVMGISATGAMSWRRAVGSDDGRVSLIGVGDGFVASTQDDSRIMMVDRAGHVSWQRRLSGRGALRHVTAVGTRAVAVTSVGDSGTWVTLLDAADGTQQWQRRWRGWNATAATSDHRRILLAMVDQGGTEQCTDSGLVELQAGDGATGATRRLDRRSAVRDLHVDGATSRLVAMTSLRSCSIAMVRPSINVYGARGLQVLHRVAMPARPCSNLAVHARLATVATCSHLVAFDTLMGKRLWTVPIASVGTRSSMAVSASGPRVTVTDDVGSLMVVEPAPAPATG